MTDTNHDRIRALIADMRGIERDYVPTADEWTDERTREIFDSPEVDRLAEIAKGIEPSGNAEVQRLTELARQIEPPARRTP